MRANITLFLAAATADCSTAFQAGVGSGTRAKHAGSKARTPALFLAAEDDEKKDNVLGDEKNDNVLDGVDDVLSEAEDAVLRAEDEMEGTTDGLKIEGLGEPPPPPRPTAAHSGSARDGRGGSKC